MARLTQAIKNVVDSSPQFNTRLEQAEKLAEKWQKLGLMEGLSKDKDAFLRTNVALMLENQAKQILRQANSTSNTQFSQEWVGIAMPLIRRFMHKLAAKDFVTIQAMSQPTGLVFYIDHQFAGTEGAHRRGFQTGSSIYGTTFDNKSGDFGYVMDTDITAGLYGAGKWGYSLNEITTSIALDNLSVNSGSAITPKIWKYDTRFSNSYAGSLTDGTIGIIGVSHSATSIDDGLVNSDLNGYDSFYIQGGDFSKSFPQYSYINGDMIYFVVEKTGTGSFTEGVTVSWHKQPQTYDRGDFEYRGNDLQSDDIGIPQIQFKLSQKPIVPETRKMKASWTQELIDDLNALLAIDGEQEISNQLTDQITLETDLELVSLIGKGAVSSGNNGYFSIRVGYEPTVNGKTVTFTNANKESYAIPGRAEWFKNIAIPMQQVSNKIHQKTGKGGANFAIVSPDVATVLETMEGFTMDTDGTQEWMEGGFTKAGSFKGRYKIYKNPYSVSDNTIIMGYRGTGFLDFGAAYCPYIPLMILPNIMEPTNLTPTKGVYTRYAKTMLRKDYYGMVFIEGLETL